MKNTVPTLLSNRTKRWFVRDTSLPICVVQEPYFTAAIEAIDPHYDSIAKLKLLTDMMLSLDTADADTDASGNNDSPSWLAELTKKLCGDVVGAIQATGAYQAWASQEPQPYQYRNNGISRSPIYTPCNVGKTLLSIDLAQANFNSLRLLSKDIVLGFDTYAELIGRFTKHEYFKQSKHFRQVIFGSLLPSRQQTLCRIMMDKIVTAVLLEPHVDIKLENIVSLGNDEVVLEIGNNKDVSATVERISNVLRADETTRDIAVRVEAFVLRGVSGTDKKFYVKEHVYPRADHVEFKCVPSHFFMQVYKHYTGQTIVETDLVFHHEGELSTFMKPLFARDDY